MHTRSQGVAGPMCPYFNGNCLKNNAQFKHPYMIKDSLMFSDCHFWCWYWTNALKVSYLKEYWQCLFIYSVFLYSISDWQKEQLGFLLLTLKGLCPHWVNNFRIVPVRDKRNTQRDEQSATTRPPSGPTASHTPYESLGCCLQQRKWYVKHTYLRSKCSHIKSHISTHLKTFTTRPCWSKTCAVLSVIMNITSVVPLSVEMLSAWGDIQQTPHTESLVWIFLYIAPSVL